MFLACNDSGSRDLKPEPGQAVTHDLDSAVRDSHLSQSHERRKREWGNAKTNLRHMSEVFENIELHFSSSKSSKARRISPLHTTVTPEIPESAYLQKVRH